MGGDAVRAGNADYAAGAIEQSEIATAEISPKFGECRILEPPQRRGEEDNKTAGGESTAKEGAMDSAVQRIENYETRLYCLLAEELAAGPRRVDFEEYARKMGCSRSTVTRNVGKLLDAGIVGVKDGKLFLKE